MKVTEAGAIFFLDLGEVVLTQWQHLGEEERFTSEFYKGLFPSE